MDTEFIPLAEQLRPKNINDFLGQKKLLGHNGIISGILDSSKPVSLLFFGPPGSGKTTLANIISHHFNMPVMAINGVSFSTTVFKKIAAESKGTPLYIIIDEIHRMNKAQQDALLPFVENGSIQLIGTTTENPSFEINNALLSRMTVVVFEQLSYDDLDILIKKALDKLGISFKKEIVDTIIKYSNYDARQAINIVETASKFKTINTSDDLKKVLNRKFVPYDKSGEEHFNLISAMHKAVRGSDVNASLYYFARMLNGGENPLYIGRRLIRIASEDIGNADFNALGVAINAYKAYEILGSPEGELALAQCVIYLSLAPKSVSVYNAYKDALKDSDHYSNAPVPLKFRNAPTDLMKDLQYGENYKYPPDFENSYVDEKYFPDNMPEHEYYKPVERGFEREMKKRIEYFKKLRGNIEN